MDVRRLPESEDHGVIYGKKKSKNFQSYTNLHSLEYGLFALPTAKVQEEGAIF